MSTDDEFYIGYEGGMPPGTRRRVRRVVVTAVAVLAGLAAVFVAIERPLPSARFDFGHVQSHEGFLRRSPVPLLYVPDIDRAYWLVSTGKFGADRALGTIDDGWVRLRATEITRGPWHMLEVVPGSVTRLNRPRGISPTLPGQARRVTLSGEIVDGKCFLGVMNPGNGPVHRDCAVRCLLGGVLPLLAFTDDEGRDRLAVLLGGGSDWRALAGRRVSVTGLLSSTSDGLYFLPEP